MTMKLSRSRNPLQERSLQFPILQNGSKRFSVGDQRKQICLRKHLSQSLDDPLATGSPHKPVVNDGDAKV